MSSRRRIVLPTQAVGEAQPGVRPPCVLGKERIVVEGGINGDLGLDGANRRQHRQSGGDAVKVGALDIQRGSEVRCQPPHIDSEFEQMRSQLYCGVVGDVDLPLLISNDTADLETVTPPFKGRQEPKKAVTLGKATRERQTRVR